MGQYRLDLWVTVAHFAEWLFTFLIYAAAAVLIGCVVEYLRYQRRVNRVIDNRLTSGRRPASDIPTNANGEEKENE